MADLKISITIDDSEMDSIISFLDNNPEANAVELIEPILKFTVES